MEIKKYCLRIFAALAAFGLGLALNLEYGSIRSFFAAAPPQPEMLRSGGITNQILSVLPTAENTPAGFPYENPYKATDFDVTGDYYPSDEIAKPFKGLESIRIITHDYESEKNAAIPPKGSIQFEREFKINRIAVGEVEVSFETESIGGVSYRFTGAFSNYTGQESDEKHPYDLAGHLTKLVKGKQVAQTYLYLYVGGC